MDSLPPDVQILKLAHEEHRRATLDDIINRLVALLAKSSGQTLPEGSSGSEANDHMLRELYGLSESWNRLGKRKKQMDAEGLWSQLLDACYNAELEFLKQQSIPGKSLKKLVRREQAWWEPNSRQFETGLVAPQFYRSFRLLSFNGKRASESMTKS